MQISKLKVALTSTLCLIGLFFSSVSCQAATKFEEAIKAYNGKQYRESAALLEEHLKAYPNDANASYWAAICYQQLGNMGSCRKYYRAVYTLSPNSTIGGYARDILKKIDPSFVTSATTTASASGTTSSAGQAVAADDNAVDPKLPKECDVRCQKEHGAIFVEPTINGRAMRMVLDTGAPGICVGKQQLEDIGLQPPKGKPAGASGGSSNSELIDFWLMPAKVKLGAIEKDMVIKVLDVNHADPLLGQTFFKEFEYTIDQGAGTIHFRQKGLSNGGPVRNAISVPFEFRQKAGNRIVVTVEINGHPHPVMFDTGNSAAAISFHSIKQAEDYHARVPEDAEEGRSSGVSGMGIVKYYTIPHLRLGAIDMYNVRGKANISGHEDTLPLLGEPFWKDYQYTVDMKNKVLNFVRR